jgi:hypothetical protein
VVERGPEKAGVGGSIPSLATTLLNNLSGSKSKSFTRHPPAKFHCTTSVGGKNAMSRSPWAVIRFAFTAWL